MLYEVAQAHSAVNCQPSLFLGILVFGNYKRYREQRKAGVEIQGK